MANIFIVSKNQSEIELIRKRIESSGADLGNLSFQSGRPTLDQESIESNSDLLIFNTPQIDEQAKKFIFLYRELTEDEPIIVIAKVPFDCPDLDTIKSLAIVRKPYEPKDLVGVIKNVIDKREIQHRRYPRFTVNEKALLDCYDQELKMEATIENMSKGWSADFRSTRRA